MLRDTIKSLTLCVWLTSLLALCWSQDTRDEATKTLELANGLYNRGKTLYGQAIEQYREFLRLYPDHPEADKATLYLGNCLRELGQYDEALKVYLSHQRFKGSEDRDKVNFRTGQVYFLLGKYAEAIQYLLKVDEKKADQDLASSSTFWLGWSYLKNKEPAKAIPVLTKLADGADNPLVPWANFYLGYAYLEAKDLQKAIERFQKAAAALPERRAEALFRIGEAYAKLEKYQNAYSAYKEIVEKHTESPFRGRSAFGALWSLYSAKDYANTLVVYGILENVIPAESRAEATYILGNCYYETNDLAQALKAYQQVGQEFAGSAFAADAEYKACWCLFLQGKSDELIASGKAFLKKHSNYPEIGNVHFVLGESLYEKNRVNEALDEYRAVVAAQPESPFREKATFKLGLCYLKTSQLDQARKTFRDFAAAYPASELATKALGRAAECGLTLARLKNQPEDQKAQYEEVARDYSALIEKYPKDPVASDALYQLGVTYVRLDKHEEMIRAFEKLVREYPGHENCAEAYYWLATENAKAGQEDLAANYFEQSLKLNRKGLYSEQAKYRLANLYFKKDPEDERGVQLIVEILRENLESDIPEETHLGVADLLLNKGKYDEAVEVYNLFVKKFKGKPAARLERAYYGLGDSYFKQSKWQAAIDSFAKAIEYNGQFVSLSKLNSGVAYLKLGQTKQAEELLNQVAKSGVVELEAKAYYWLGNMLFATAQATQNPQDKIKQYNLARGEYMRVVVLHRPAKVTPTAGANEGLIGRTLARDVTDGTNTAVYARGGEKVTAELLERLSKAGVKEMYIEVSEVWPECTYRAAECMEQEGLLSGDQALVEESRKLLRELTVEYPDNDFAKKARQKLGIAPAA
jgi:TolA-binding protein